MTEDETSTGQVRLERLLPVLTKVMLEKKYRAQPETILMQAFETLDVDKKGYLLPGNSLMLLFYTYSIIQKKFQNISKKKVNHFVKKNSKNFYQQQSIRPKGKYFIVIMLLY